MYEVTIAIPVYNVEPYISKCMDSALSQTFQSIEFLIIDDKGTDGSMDIVRKLKEEHPRGKDIRIVDNLHNLGLSETRNVALREASGKYLFFLDSDDYISSNCIELLYRAMSTENVQVVISSHQEVSLDGTVLNTFKLPYTVGHKPDELATLHYGSLHRALIGCAWNVLYQLDFLRNNHVSYKARRICEDTLFWLDVYPLVDSFVLLPDITYFYVIRSNSLTFSNARNMIPLSEVQERISIRDYAKKRLVELSGKPFFNIMAVRVMHLSYNAAFSIMKNRKYISPSISTREIKRLLSFPLSFKTILSLKSNKMELFLYYFFSHLPGWIQFGMLRLMRKLYV
jgi:glycosyltransferase involved in cell wall biosynthesis